MLNWPTWTLNNHEMKRLHNGKDSVRFSDISNLAKPNMFLWLLWSLFSLQVVSLKKLRTFYPSRLPFFRSLWWHVYLFNNIERFTIYFTFFIDHAWGRVRHEWVRHFEAVYAKSIFNKRMLILIHGLFPDFKIMLDDTKANLELRKLGRTH